MDAPQRPVNNGNGSRTPTPVVVHLSGPCRGTTEFLAGDLLRIGTEADAEIRLESGHPALGERHATLRRRGQTYELVVEAGRDVWVNGEHAERMVLASGDVLEIGKEGPVLRFRLYAPGVPPHKSLTQVFSDCLACARHERGGPLRRASAFFRTMPRELATQTSPRFRIVSVLVALLLVATAVLVQRTIVLEQRVADDRALVTAVADLIEQGRAANPVNADELTRGLERVRDDLDAAAQRLGRLEHRAGAGTRVIAATSRSIAFLQGAYGFVDPRSGAPLRLAVGPDGRPQRDDAGGPMLTTEPDGPVFEVFFTGTAFAATEDDLLLTNRHIAEPWEFEGAAQQVISRGWRGVMRRLVAYLPGVVEPLEVALVEVDDDADLALLRFTEGTAGIPALPLSDAPSRPGDEVIVLGYPLGMRALMARTDAAFVQTLRRDGDLDFWRVARRLSQDGRIEPLASRGIVGQVTPQAVVYDAETTSGGSGGPVLNLEGEVVAVTMGVMPEFGGSNLGVPAAQVRRLIRRATARRP